MTRYEQQAFAVIQKLSKLVRNKCPDFLIAYSNAYSKKSNTDDIKEQRCFSFL